MGLPSITAPEYTLKLPSNDEEIKYRPFLVKEEKLLLFALESDKGEDKINAVAQMIDNCVLNEKFKSKSLPYFDFESLLLHIRAKSVGETSTVTVQHNKEGCNHENEVVINLDKIVVDSDDKHENQFSLTDQYSIKMKYPTIQTIMNFAELKNENDISKIIDMFADCIDCVYDGENVYDDFTKKEAVEFLESLSKEQFEKVALFFQTMPSSKIEVNYKCQGCGDEVKTMVSGFDDFFS